MKLENTSQYTLHRAKRSWVLTQCLAWHKTFEGELLCGSHSGAGFNIKLTTKRDHAGLTFFVCLFGFSIEVTLTDVRHWNVMKDRWYYDGEEPVFEGYPHE